jgi:AraC-like DNA-binding protein
MTADANPLTSRARSEVQEGPPTTATQFRVWVEAFERLGYDVAPQLAQSGITRADLDDPDALIPCAACGAFFARIQQTRPLQNMWARLGVETPSTAFPLLEYLVHTSHDVGEGCKQLGRYLRLVGAPFTLDIRDDEDPIRVVYLMAPRTSPASAEYGVAIHVCRVREETDDQVQFAYASFTHQPDNVLEIEQLLGCPVRSGASWAGLALPREAWQIPLRRRDPVLRRMLQGQADAIAEGPAAVSGVLVDVRRALAVRLPRGEAEIEVVARHLGMSTRTLQRRLSSTGTSYQELLDVVRRESAEKCIADSSLSIGEIAYLVGYSEPAAFHRAFRRWTGSTPHEFRQRLRRRTKSDGRETRDLTGSLATGAWTAHSRAPEERP